MYQPHRQQRAIGPWREESRLSQDSQLAPLTSGWTQCKNSAPQTELALFLSHRYGRYVYRNGGGYRACFSMLFLYERRDAPRQFPNIIGPFFSGNLALILSTRLQIGSGICEALIKANGLVIESVTIDATDRKWKFGSPNFGQTPWPCVCNRSFCRLATVVYESTY